MNGIQAHTPTTICTLLIENDRVKKFDAKDERSQRQCRRCMFPYSHLDANNLMIYSTTLHFWFQSDDEVVHTFTLPFEANYVVSPQQTVNLHSSRSLTNQ